MKLPVKCTILIDTREQQPLFVADSSDKEANYISEKVDAGDYSVRELPRLIAIERKKSGLELWSNLTKHKDRFLREVDRLREFKHRYIIIEQSYDEFLDQANWRPIRSVKRRLAMIATVEGWLIALQEKENIHFIFAGDGTKRLTKRLLVKHYQYERKRLINESIQSETSESEEEIN